MKTCRKCQQPKEESEFYKQSGTKDGLKYECKSCAKTRSSTRYENFSEAEKKEYINKVIERRKSKSPPPEIPPVS